MCTLANNDDPDEMPYNLHSLLGQKQSTEKELQFYLEIITFDPSIYTIDHPKFIVSNLRKSPYVHKELMKQCRS